MHVPGNPFRPTELRFHLVLSTVSVMARNIALLLVAFFGLSCGPADALYPDRPVRELDPDVDETRLETARPAAEAAAPASGAEPPHAPSRRANYRRQPGGKVAISKPAAPQNTPAVSPESKS